MSLLEIRNLHLSIGATPILRGLDLDLARGEVLGLVGESGSGKSMTALSIMKLLPSGAKTSGHIRLDGIDIMSAPEAAMCRVRGNEAAMVFQEPMSALNPLKTIGEQVAEGIRWHQGINRSDAEAKARAMLNRVGLPESKFPLTRYPHELSGGQRQRVVIAIACALNPKLLIADEPTTALDVVLQAQILNLLSDLVEEQKMSLLLISHDLAVVSQNTDRILILKDGQMVEQGQTNTVLAQPQQAYTQQLLEASTHVPIFATAKVSTTQEPLLRVQGVSVDYKVRRSSLFAPPSKIRAVDQVSFTINEGQSVALVGQSGCGKSTLARAILALEAPSEGSISFDAISLDGKTEQTLRQVRRNMQVVFQDPYGSFDPRLKVDRLVAEPLYLLEENLPRNEQRKRVAEVLEQVGLSPSDMEKYPHEFSGGQRQRLAIARAIITRPKLVIADEPVSALDVSIRAQILDLFADLNGQLGIAYLFITHDLSVARAISDTTMVMHEGKIVESGPTLQVLKAPQTAPAKALVDATPILEQFQFAK